MLFGRKQLLAGRFLTISSGWRMLASCRVHIYHVGVADRFHLVCVKILDDTVEQGCMRDIQSVKTHEIFL